MHDPIERLRQQYEVYAGAPRLRLKILRRACAQVLKDLGPPERNDDYELAALGMILACLVRILNHVLKDRGER